MLLLGGKEMKEGKEEKEIKRGKENIFIILFLSRKNNAYKIQK